MTFVDFANLTAADLFLEPKRASDFLGFCGSGAKNTNWSIEQSPQIRVLSLICHFGVRGRQTADGGDHSAHSLVTDSFFCTQAGDGFKKVLRGDQVT